MPSSCISLSSPFLYFHVMGKLSTQEVSLGVTALVTVRSAYCSLVDAAHLGALTLPGLCAPPQASCSPRPTLYLPRAE